MRKNLKIKSIIDLIFDTFDISTAFIDERCNTVYERKIKLKEDTNLELEYNLKAVVHSMENKDFPQIISTPYYENFICISVDGGYVIAGPSLYSHVTPNIMKNICKGLTIEKGKEFTEYFKQLPVIGFDKLNHITALIYFMISGKHITADELIEKNFYHINKVISVRERISKSFSVARQNTAFHHSYESEKVLFDCIRRGDTKSLLKNLNKPLEGEAGILALNNPLRSKKNILIALTAIASRTVIEEGLPAELSYNLSDSYIQIVEETESIKDLDALMITMLCDFSNLIKEYKGTSYPKVVRNVIDYIFRHLYEKMNVEEMAKSIHFNPNYLSSVFKEETGKTISEFITHERIEESKKLLAYTKFSIIDIVTLLHFHDQSHFTRVFKKETGTTPKKYRDQY